jgi:hypothetical protein
MRFDRRQAVIARSDSDEAIHSSFDAMDCFASLAMTIQPNLILLYPARISNSTLPPAWVWAIASSTRSIG